jgi:hypothetical protein
MSKTYEIQADDHTGELPAEVQVIDDNGAIQADAYQIVHLMNSAAMVKLPWMGNLRVCRDIDGYWYVEERCAHCGHPLEKRGAD